MKKRIVMTFCAVVVLVSVAAVTSGKIGPCSEKPPSTGMITTTQTVNV